MNKKEKQKYVPCELSVVKFKVERGFATSEGFVNTTGMAVGTWRMGQSNGDYQNEQYGRYNNNGYDHINSWNNDLGTNLNN